MVSAWFILALATSIVAIRAAPVATNRGVCPAPETDSIQSPHQACTPTLNEYENVDDSLVGSEKSRLAIRAQSSKESGTEGEIPFIPRPASLTKHQRLIGDIVERTLAHAADVFVPSSSDPRWKEPPQSDMTAEEVFARYGLQPAPTPATGNCQYYAIAMALLGMRFDTPQHYEELEQMTRVLKQGIAEASRHGFDVEFPHDTRQTILAVNRLETGDDQELEASLTEEESSLLFQEYIQDISQSASAVSAFVSPELWGTEVTLRMMAKLLQQPIFLIIVPYGLEAAPSYQVYEPEQTVKGGYQLDSADEHYFASSKLDEWLSRLQRACRDTSSMTNPPIVLMFSELHYNRVEFAPAPVSSA